MSGSLSHLHVLDLSRVLAGPSASQILGDLGARSLRESGQLRATTHAHGGRPISRGMMLMQRSLPIS
ncbi:hypothetical protein BCA33_01845 [Marinobacter sp. AC-23]|nr:hypothetical protein BCA33_01845 [Marinobacter sp. AC-23]